MTDGIEGLPAFLDLLLWWAVREPPLQLFYHSITVAALLFTISLGDKLKSKVSTHSPAAGQVSSSSPVVSQGSSSRGQDLDKFQGKLF